MKRTLFIVLMMSLMAACANADIIVDTGVTSFTATSTQFGRISRNGVASDWGSPKPFPGVTGAPGARGYEFFTVNTGIYSYIQIDLDDPTTSLFVSAYLNSYNPVNSGPNFGLNVNYLGDPGLSQPLGNPSFFDIVVTPFSTLIIPINEINLGGGAGKPFELAVEGFCSADFGDTSNGGCTQTAPTPEPGSIILLGTGLSLAVQRLRKRYSA
jgi:hypothetical protein